MDFVEVVYSLDADLSEGIRKDGTVPVKIIQPGWGSSGYYSEALLQKHARLFEGAHMYWDHPTASERTERPERSLKDLAAVLEGGVFYQESGPQGPGLYGTAKVFGPYRETVAELAPYIGLSIRASGVASRGEAAGRKGNLVESFKEVHSVDFVTKPGAGGRVLSLFESAHGLNKQGDDDMELSEAISKLASAEAELKETRSNLDARDTELAGVKKELEEAKRETARLQEAAIMREARDYAAERLAKAKLPGDRSLPDVTIARIAEAVSSNPPVRDGALDKSAFDKSIDEARDDEVKYLTSILGESGAPTVRRMGRPADTDRIDTKETADRLDKAFGALGLSESARKVAVEGR